MKKTFLLLAGMLVFSSCVSSKKYKSLEAEQKETKDNLTIARSELAACLDAKKRREAEIRDLRNSNSRLLTSVGELATLSKKEAENLERSLESIKEKDLQIKTMRDAVNKKDSVTLALVTSLKGAIGNMDDEDIQISVEKGVVYVSISDKFLFRSGSFGVSQQARPVLEKVAKVLAGQPELEVMVEGHTDNKPIATNDMADNWDLSVKRATSIVRILEKDFNVSPDRMIAAGRSYHKPVASNDTSEGRSANRRTRIVVLPKLDQFFGLIEDGMKNQK